MQARIHSDVAFHIVRLQLAAWIRVLLEKQTVAQLGKKFARLLWNTKIYTYLPMSEALNMVSFMLMCHSSSPQDGRPPLVGCSRFVIQVICSLPLEAVSFILSTHHAVVTRNPVTKITET
jgi:hypothetical protein